MSDSDQYGEYIAADYIYFYYLWVVLAVGLPGNIASFITIVRMPPLTSSTGYVVALAVVDSLSIITKLLFQQLTMYDVRLGPGGCQILFFIGTFLIMYANWILVAMSVERFIAIWFPLKVTTLCTGKKSFALMGMVAIVLTATDLHFLWTATDAGHDTGDMTCGFKPEYLNFIQYYWYWIDGSLYAIIPCILLVLFNVLIIVGIRRSRIIQKDLMNNNSQMAQKYRQERQITIMLVVASVVFVVCILPNCIFFIVKPYWVIVPRSRGHAVYYLVSQLIFLLSDVNHAVNFYLYFLTARRFRRRFMDMICCRSSRRNSFTSRMSTANSNVSNTSIYTTQTSMDWSGNNNCERYSTTTTTTT